MALVASMTLKHKLPSSDLVIMIYLSTSRPDLVDFRKLSTQTAKENLEMAFSLAEKEYQVTRLLDPEGQSKVSQT